MAERVYRDSDFSNPGPTCDLIMKGGITSGVVYPLAITELAKRYRFANIGGTSAGAIAAAAAAAAEYGRNVPGRGFMRLATLPGEAGQILFSLFQPTAKVAPIFQILVAALKNKSTTKKISAIVTAAICGYRRAALLGFAAGAAIALIIGLIVWWTLKSGGAAFMILLAVLALVLALLGMAVAVVLALKRSALEDLPKNNYGLCSGIKQPGFEGPGFTDWLADLIDEAAGRDPKRDAPLTFGDLARPRNGQPIVLRMMTTNLMASRPYSLPLQDQTYKFKRSDFEKIFPQRIMQHLLRVSERFVPPAGGNNDEYYQFPAADDLPIVVAARMSLSFPLLISAVPLYAQDFTLKAPHNKALQLCLFSDGGLSSNFPIHFFDNMLPSSPTFGISLDEYDERRDRAPPGTENRVWMPSPTSAGGGSLLPLQSFDGLAAFLMRLINAAKDWQDNLQGTLAGYRDRIVRVYLRPDEGGLNIVMPPALVGQLSQYGAVAGDNLRDKFDLDEHRWRRFLVAMDRFDETLGNVVQAYNGRPGGPEAFSTFLQRYPQSAKSYKQGPAELTMLLARADDLAKLATKWGTPPALVKDKLPHPKTDLRVAPRP